MLKGFLLHFRKTRVILLIRLENDEIAWPGIVIAVEVFR